MMTTPKEPKKKGRFARVIDRGLWLIVAAIVIIALWPRGKGPSEGKPAPALDVMLLGTEDRFVSDGQRDKPLLIEAFASWCGACKRNKGLLNSFEGSALNEKIETLAISVDSSPGAAARAKLTWPILGQVALDDTGTFNRDYGIEVLPTYILVGRDGVVLRSHAGGLQPAQLESWLELAQTRD